MSVEVLARNTCTTTGEGPFWNAATQNLLYVDAQAGDVHQCNTLTGEDNKVNFDAAVTFVIPRTCGGFIISNDRKLVSTDDQFTNIQVLAEVEHGMTTRFNDAKCDSTGRLWAGTMGRESKPAVPERQQGALYSFDNAQKLTKWVEKLDISNGMAWNKADNIMYFIDSFPRKVYAFDYEAKSGTIGNQRVVVDFGDDSTIPEIGYPDGMAIDQDDKIWVACYLGGRVIQFDPNTGQEIRHIKLPAKRTTSCCFGGPNYDTMFVTCGRTGASEEELSETPLAGSVFKITGLGSKGYPAFTFKDMLV